MPSHDRREINRRYYFKKKLERQTLSARPKQSVGRPPLHEADKKVLVAIRIPVSVLGRIQRIVGEAIALHTYPWKTQSALINELLLRGLESLKDDPNIAEMLQYLHTVEEIEAVGKHRIEAKAAFSKFNSEVSEMLAIGATMEAAQYYQNTHKAVLALSPNLWRDWLLIQMEKAHGKLAKVKVKPTSLASNSRSSIYLARKHSEGGGGA